MAQKGDHSAFSELMGRHKHWLLRFIMRFVRGEDEAMDVLQETFVSAWFSIDTFDIHRRFDIWIRRIAMNKCRDHGRRNIVYRAALGSFALLSQLSGRHVEKPAAENGQWEAGQALHAAIAKMPESVRYPLILTALEGLSHKEAGEVLNLTPKAIEVRIYRARRILSDVLPRDLLQDIAGGSD